MTEETPAQAAAEAAYRAAQAEEEELRRLEGEMIMDGIRRAHMQTGGELGNAWRAEEEAKQRKAAAEAEEVEQAQAAQDEAEQEIAYLEGRLAKLRGERK